MERTVVEESIRDVTRRLWDGMLGLSTEEREAPFPWGHGPYCMARISISGAWTAEVVVQAHAELAKQVARVMFSMDSDEEPLDAQVEDCIKELANITAGNLKTALPEPCVLSTPDYLGVTDRAGFENPDYHLAFESCGRDFHVILRRRE